MKYTLNCVSWNSLKEIFHSASSPFVISLNFRQYTFLFLPFYLLSKFTTYHTEVFFTKSPKRFSRPDSIDFKRVNYNYFLQTKSDKKNITYCDMFK